MERHRHRHTETCKLRGTHTLRQTPSSKKGHTLLRLKYAHTHTLRQRNVNNRNEPHTHTLRETYMHRETHTERETKVHRETHTETCKLRGTHTLRETPSPGRDTHS